MSRTLQRTVNGWLMACGCANQVPPSTAAVPSESVDVAQSQNSSSPAPTVAVNERTHECPVIKLRPLERSSIVTQWVQPNFACPAGSSPIPGGTVLLKDSHMAIRTNAGKVVGARRTPSESVDVAPFCLDRLEVTNGELSYGKDESPEARLPAEVAYWTAEQYCSQLGGRLPASAEWLIAVLETRTTHFPWGDEIAREGVCWLKPEGAPPCEVGTNPLDKSEQQVFDLVANAREWTAKETDGVTRVVGVPRDTCGALVLYLDFRQSSTFRADEVFGVNGFRCVRPIIQGS